MPTLPLLLQFVLRRHLQTHGLSLTGLYPGNPTKQAQKPTIERASRALSTLTLTFILITRMASYTTEE